MVVRDARVEGGGGRGEVILKHILMVGGGGFRAWEWVGNKQGRRVVRFCDAACPVVVIAG